MMFYMTLLLLVWSPSQAQKDAFLNDLLKKNPELFRPILENPAKYDVQILYTQINRDAQNNPTFRTYRYRVDKDRYFYPASTVKFPAVLLALEKLNELKLDPATPMLTDSAGHRQTAVRSDPTSPNGLPSVAHYAKKILLVSDNDAFNRLYELMGQCDMNERLYDKGYKNLRIVHRLEVGMNREQNRRTNPVRFVENGKVLYQQPMQVCGKTYRSETPIRRGIGFMRNDSLIRQPFDFTERNYFALEEQQDMLRAVLFPESVPPRQRFNLTSMEYDFLYRYMSEFPRESTFPKYDTTYYDSYCKFLLTGDNKKSFPKNVRIFNKVGDAYGYLIDNAYIVDFERGVEFMLAAVIHCNEDGIFNDNKYEYDTIGMPFLANLGRVIYDYEVKRRRAFKPDLRKFMVKYE